MYIKQWQFIFLSAREKQKYGKKRKKINSQTPMIMKRGEPCLCKWWRNPKMFHLANLPKEEGPDPFFLVCLLAGGFLALILHRGDYIYSF